jgi:hypothetical protein
MAATTVTADAFGSAYIPLPALSLGTQRIRIAGSAAVGGQTLQDAMTRTFSVVASRATQQRTTWLPLSGTTRVEVGQGMTNVVLVDAGRGRVVPTLEELATSGGVRADQVLASALATRVLTEQFGIKGLAAPDPNGLDAYASGGDLSIVPWGSAQLDVTALAAIAGDSRIVIDPSSSMLASIAGDAGETRARRLLALAGLAALGQPVQDRIAAAAAQTDLGVEEQVYLALAALEAGDEALAGRLEQQLLAQHGLQSGHQVRLDAGADTDTTLVTARLAIVAASLGDPIAAEMDEYVAAHPSKSTLVVLERAIAARGWALRVASTPVKAALTVDGVRTDVTLSSGDAAAYSLTPAQAASATLAPVSGSVLAIQTWDDALEPSSLTPPDGVSFTRTVTPGGEVAADGTVIVEFEVTLTPDQSGGQWQVVENVPSGLAPIPYFGAPDDPEALAADIAPAFVDGQRVAFMVGWDPLHPTQRLRYVARVVTAGTYAWEPSVLQSTVAPASGLTVPAETVTIATPAPGS